MHVGAGSEMMREVRCKIAAAVPTRDPRDRILRNGRPHRCEDGPSVAATEELRRIYVGCE